MTLSRVLVSEHAVVASEQPLASFAGLDALKKGGNAVDAAVATSLALGVTFHPAGGLGGDFFALVYEASTGRVHCLNSSGWAPSGLTLELLRSKGEKGIPLFGPCSVVIPGAVAGICALHKKFGSLEFRGLPSAAVGYAKEGFPISAGFSRSIGATLDSFSKPARKVFAPAGAVPAQGDIIRQRNLGSLIEAIAREGPAAFYRGAPADELLAIFSENGIEAGASDFADFKPEWVAPLKLEHEGTTVYEVPPNSMGATSLLMLEHLSRRNISRMKPLSSQRVRATMDAAELAYERRDRMLGDPRFGRIDVDAFLKLDEPTKPHSSPRLRPGDTTAFSVVDGQGNIVSAIQSLFHFFGSRVFAEGCGVMLNNRGAGFRTAGPNGLLPRKRPLHTLSALLLARGDEPYIALGCSGGDFRPMQHSLFVSNIVDYRMALEQSVDFPRFLRIGRSSMIIESGYDSLRSLPYKTKRIPHPAGTGVCQGVEILPRARKAVCDVRGDGLPAGF